MEAFAGGRSDSVDAATPDMDERTDMLEPCRRGDGSLGALE
jgi:hypothetical protein